MDLQKNSRFVRSQDRFKSWVEPFRSFWIEHGPQCRIVIHSLPLFCGAANCAQ